MTFLLKKNYLKPPNKTKRNLFLLNIATDLKVEQKKIKSLYDKEKVYSTSVSSSKCADIFFVGEFSGQQQQQRCTLIKYKNHTTK